MQNQQEQGGLEQLFTGWANEVDKLEKGFRGLLNRYAEEAANLRRVPSETIHFVILIDDLDRCMPETTIAILEGIKNYLMVESDDETEEGGINRSIFILGLNAKVVYQGIKIKYKGLDIDGREYPVLFSLLYGSDQPKAVIEAVGGRQNMLTWKKATTSLYRPPIPLYLASRDSLR